MTFGRSPVRAALFFGLLLIWVGGPALAVEDEPEFLLLEVRLDQFVLTGAMPALDNGEHVFLPLGELSRLLTIAISSKPEDGTATGYVLDESRSFSLSLDGSQVSLAGVTKPLNTRLVIQEPDDLYVAIELLEQWLPLAMDVDFSSLSLRVQPLETLPLQAQLDRQQRGAATGFEGSSDRGYPYTPVSYQWLSMPTVDQTLSWDYRNTTEEARSSGRYTAYLTGDLAGMEAAAFFSVSEPESEADVKLSAGRSDPEGRLLGPLQARSFRFGSLSSPAVANITPAWPGLGLTVSNRPLTRPEQFDRHSFSGDLLPGWDVELYYNGALVDYRQPDPDDRYQFNDQPLYYGANDFQLVFNGPMGQQRIEKVSFNLAQSMVLPRELQYNLALNEGDDGQSRAHIDVDVGVHRQLTLSGAFTHTPVGDDVRDYTSLGARTYWRAFSISGDWVQDMGGGNLLELGVQSRVNGVSVNANRIQLNDFSSAVFTARNDPLLVRSQLELSGSMPLGSQFRLPVTATLGRDEYQSGQFKDEARLKVSSYLWGTSLTSTLDWQSEGEEDTLSGTFQANRRVRYVGLRAQLAYNFEPNAELTELSLATNQTLGNAYRLGLTAHHSFLSSHTRYSAAVNKNLGRFGLGLDASYTDTDEHTVGARISMSMGQNPQNGRWRLNAKPAAGSGEIAVRAFLDDNRNGVMDEGETPLEGVGFDVNGSRHQARTDASGTAYLDHLPTRRYLDISLEPGTLEDPQWHSTLPGKRVLLRPGRATSLEFPVEVTTEIDGTVYLLSDESERGVSDVHLELLDEHNKIVADIRTSWDGYYILPDISSGVYWLRVDPDQLRQLGWRDTGIREITVLDNGDYVSGMDFVILAKEYTAFSSAAQLDYQSIEGYRTAPWIIGQPDEHFTIQIMAARNESIVRQFIDKHQLNDQVAYFESRYQGGPWFSVIYGNFDSYSEAKAAAVSLPAPLKAAGPWVRSYSGIKALLK